MPSTTHLASGINYFDPAEVFLLHLFICIQGNAHENQARLLRTLSSVAEGQRLLRLTSDFVRSDVLQEVPHNLGSTRFVTGTAGRLQATVCVCLGMGSIVRIGSFRTEEWRTIVRLAHH